MKKGFYLSGLLALSFLFGSTVAKAAIPTVRTNPHDTTACTGMPVTFSVFATDTPGTLPMTYQWQVSTDGTTWSDLSDGTFYSGTDQDTLHVTTDLSLDGQWYRAIVRNTTGADTSTHGILDALAYPDAGTITGASSVCKSSFVFLSDNIAGGTWLSSNTAVANVAAPGTIFGAGQGFATISYTTSNGYCTSTTIFGLRVDTIVTALPITGATSVCKNSTITLMNANNLYGTGTWSSSGPEATVSAGGVVTGHSYGAITITYDFTNACNSVSSTHSVQVDTILNHGVISGPASVCTSSTIHLNETVTGGMWLSSSTGVANVDGSGNVTGVALGTAVISYYMANACGASVATYTISVAAPAGAITGTDSVGIGGTRTLGNPVAGGVWSSTNTAIAHVGASTGVVTGVAAGITTIIYTVTNACGTTSTSIPFYVGGAPSAGAITGVDSVCVGASINLSNSVAGGVWSVSNTHATINASGVVTGVSTGLDTAIYTVTSGFGTSSVKKKFYVNHLPIITLTGPAIIARSANYFFTGVPAGGTFTHTNNTMGVFVSFTNTGGVSYGSYVVLDTGTDVIRYRVTNSCGTVDSFFTVVLHGSAPEGVTVVTNAGATLSVYPNPTNGDVKLNLSTELTEDATIVITNMVGAKVKELTMSTNKETNIQLDQPAGMYILTAVTAHGKYTTKITVAK